MTDPRKIVYTATYKKDTHATFVYQDESPAKGNPIVSQSFYVNKWVFGKVPPQRVRITVEEIAIGEDTV